ncbi:hypothetical protein WJX75_006242 [Coccomyxa subellipsoidea]|uniref:Uncharacterized protein n=1 Tax=Coccomyxa subellipsoidea TaxID=248742 RepID=A0ABR2Z0U7_9CHLO
MALGEPKRWQSSPTVFDKLVDVLVFDTHGRRHNLRGREGQVLVDLLAENEDVLGSDVVGLSPEGRGVMEAVVSIPNQYLAQIPPPSPEDMRALAELSPSGTTVSKNARLASKILLTSALDDVHIALTPLQPWRTL